MLVGYIRVSKADGPQTVELQCDALRAAGVGPAHLYDDQASDRRDDRPGLAACLKALRGGDTLVVWKLDRLGVLHASSSSLAACASLVSGATCSRGPLERTKPPELLPEASQRRCDSYRQRASRT